ncbi:hypothetical protein ACFV2H_37485 [Streptomyces sp. NPDC059629]|uniref:hypothetical protein n=1 Tax=Streptomyces sp. NPDC059629 TaxID=3346889 RepID=UPI0036B355CB
MAVVVQDWCRMVRERVAQPLFGSDFGGDELGAFESFPGRVLAPEVGRAFGAGGCHGLAGGVAGATARFALPVFAHPFACGHRPAQLLLAPQQGVFRSSGAFDRGRFRAGRSARSATGRRS